MFICIGGIYVDVTLPASMYSGGYHAWFDFYQTKKPN